MGFQVVGSRLASVHVHPNMEKHVEIPDQSVRETVLEGGQESLG